MDVKELKNSLKTKINNVYIFTGEEVGIRDLYVSKLKKQLNLPIVYLDSYLKNRKRIKGTSLFKEKCLYIILEDKELQKEEKIFDEILSTKSNIIFLYQTLDKRTKFYKTFKDVIVEFNTTTSEELVKAIQSTHKLNTHNCEILINFCGNDYARIKLELDKLKIYSEVKNLTINDSFEEIKSCLYKEPEDAIFEVINYILKKDPENAYKKLLECERLGESNINILFNLYNTTKNVLLVQSCTSQDIEKSTGLSKYIIKHTKEKCGYYKLEDLRNILRLVQRVDTCIKKGLINEEHSVRYVISIIFNSCIYK